MTKEERLSEFDYLNKQE